MKRLFLTFAFAGLFQAGLVAQDAPSGAATLRKLEKRVAALGSENARLARRLNAVTAGGEKQVKTAAATGAAPVADQAPFTNSF